MREVIRHTYFDGVDLIPGNIEVMEYEHETPRVRAEKGVLLRHLFAEYVLMPTAAESTAIESAGQERLPIKLNRRHCEPRETLCVSLGEAIQISAKPSLTE